MIVDAAQILHFKAVLGLTDHNSDLSEWLITLDAIDCYEETRVVWHFDHVHFVVLIKLEELHCVALQSDLLLRLLADLLHVHVVVLFILIIDLIDVNKNLIIVKVEQLFDDVDDWKRDSEVDGVLVGVDVHVHYICVLDLAINSSLYSSHVLTCCFRCDK